MYLPGRVAEWIKRSNIYTWHKVWSMVSTFITTTVIIVHLMALLAGTTGFSLRSHRRGPFLWTAKTSVPVGFLLLSSPSLKAVVTGNNFIFPSSLLVSQSSEEEDLHLDIRIKMPRQGRWCDASAVRGERVEPCPGLAEGVRPRSLRGSWSSGECGGFLNILSLG